MGDRRLALLRDLASRLAATRATEEVFGAVEHCLGRNSPDLPFSLTYLFEDDARRARLVSRTEISADHPAAARCRRAGAPSRWPFADVRAGDVPVVVDWMRLFPGPGELATILRTERSSFRSRAGSDTTSRRVHRGTQRPSPLDDAYRAFIRLFVGQLPAGLANARAYEAERRRAEALAEIDRAKTGSSATSATNSGRR